LAQQKGLESKIEVTDCGLKCQLKIWSWVQREATRHCKSDWWKSWSMAADWSMPPL